MAVLVAAPAHADLILHYTFDDASNPTADTGTGTAANGNLSSGSSYTTSTPGGSGYAFNTGSGVNTYLTTGANDTGGDANKLDSLSTFTISGWLNLQADPTAGSTPDRLVSKWASTPSAAGYELTVGNATTGTTTAGNFTLRLQIQGNTVVSTVSTGADHSWLFFAVTYNSVTGMVNFYVGDTASTVTTLGSSLYIAGGVTSDNTAPLQVGGTAATASDRTPSGYFDDIRIYNTVLNAGELESVRAANVPEAATLGMLAVAGAGLLIKRRKH